LYPLDFHTFAACGLFIQILPYGKETIAEKGMSGEIRRSTGDSEALFVIDSGNDSLSAAGHVCGRQAKAKHAARR
jgi:hypothetical protein